MLHLSSLPHILPFPPLSFPPSRIRRAERHNRLPPAEQANHKRRQETPACCNNVQHNSLILNHICIFFSAIQSSANIQSSLGKSRCQHVPTSKFTILQPIFESYSHFQVWRFLAYVILPPVVLPAELPPQVLLCI